MNILLIAILVVVAALAFVEEYIPHTVKKVAAAVLVLILILMSGLKGIETTADASVYENMFFNNDSLLIEVMTEPTYIYISRLVLLFGGTVTVVFFIYALISIPMKVSVVWKMTPYFFTALIVYIGMYYPLHDVVQIRAGVATAFVMLSVIPYTNRKYLLSAILWLCAFLFHYSSVAFLPVYVIGNMGMNKYWRWALAFAVVASLALSVLGLNLFSLLPASWVTGKLDVYERGAEIGDAMFQPYTPYKQISYLGEFALFFVYLFYYDCIAEKTRYASVVLKSIALSMIYFAVFASIPVLGFRMHELLAVFSIIGYSYIVYLVNPGWVAKAGILVITFIAFLIQMLNDAYFI